MISNVARVYGIAHYREKVLTKPFRQDVNSPDLMNIVPYESGTTIL